MHSIGRNILSIRDEATKYVKPYAGVNDVSGRVWLRCSRKNGTRPKYQKIVKTKRLEKMTKVVSKSRALSSARSDGFDGFSW